MITKENAKHKLDMARGGRYGSSRRIEMMNVIDEIYSSRGTCGTCKHSDDFNKDYIFCKILGYSLEPTWFCADYEEMG